MRGSKCEGITSLFLSDVPSPFTTERIVPLSTEQVRTIVACFVETIAGVKDRNRLFIGGEEVEP